MDRCTVQPINLKKRPTFDQYFKLLEAPNLLKGDGLGMYFLLDCCNNWKKYQLELLFDIRNKKLCSQRLRGIEVKGFLLEKNQ